VFSPPNPEPGILDVLAPFSINSVLTVVISLPLSSLSLVSPTRMLVGPVLWGQIWAKLTCYSIVSCIC